MLQFELMLMLIAIGMKITIIVANWNALECRLIKNRLILYCKLIYIWKIWKHKLQTSYFLQKYVHLRNSMLKNGSFGITYLLCLLEKLFCISLTLYAFFDICLHQANTMMYYYFFNFISFKNKPPLKN